jgi:hypothetical protein
MSNLFKTKDVRVIGFTGMHGGAPGFDSQVEEFAKAHGIHQVIVRPNYLRYPPKVAPHVRNREIVDACDVLVTCWDGRKRGGTYQCREYARQRRREVFGLRALDPRFTGAYPVELVPEDLP